MCSGTRRIGEPWFNLHVGLFRGLSGEIILTVSEPRTRQHARPKTETVREGKYNIPATVSCQEEGVPSVEHGGGLATPPPPGCLLSPAGRPGQTGGAGIQYSTCFCSTIQLAM